MQLTVWPTRAFKEGRIRRVAVLQARLSFNATISASCSGRDVGGKLCVGVCNDRYHGDMDTCMHAHGANFAHDLQYSAQAGGHNHGAHGTRWAWA